ncbi:MAG: DNA-binding HxlR family transcriptional regulator [Candidatus Nanohaloarchaea archaeon]|jgi:DNA-binding HxlR family transcriptional regulator
MGFMEGRNMPEWCETQEWCPITVTSELLGRKWHPVIVHRLLQKPMRFNELQREVHHISDKVLSDSLEDLREKGVVKKDIVSQSPKKVKYSLTESGKSLENVIEHMFEWGKENADRI